MAGSLTATALSLLCVWRIVHKAKSKTDISLGWDRVEHGLLTALPRPFCEGCLRTLFRSG